MPQLTASLVEAIPCEWYNYFKWAKGISKPVNDDTLEVFHLKWDLGGDYGVPKLSKVTPFWVLHCYTDRRRVPKLSKRRPAWGERRATQKVEWAIQSWRTAGKKLDKHGFATHRTRACARVWQLCLTPNLTFLQSHSTQLVYDEKSSDMSSYCTIFDGRALRHFNNAFVELNYIFGKGKACLVLNMNSKDWR